MQAVVPQDRKVVTMTTTPRSMRFLIGGLDVPDPDPDPDLPGPSAADVQTIRETPW